MAVDSSGAPPDYEGRIALDPTLLDAERLEAVLETGGFVLSNMRVHQNLVLHHLGRSMRLSDLPPFTPSFKPFLSTMAMP